MLVMCLGTVSLAVPPIFVIYTRSPLTPWHCVTCFCALGIGNCFLFTVRLVYLFVHCVLRQYNRSSSPLHLSPLLLVFGMEFIIYILRILCPVSISYNFCSVFIV